MATDLVTREQVEQMLADAEQHTSKELIEDFRWILDAEQTMGEPRTWVEIAPGLQALVHPENTNYVLLFYPRAKRWVDPTWKPTVYGP